MAYFGPQKRHAEEIEACGAQLLRFDFFHKGIESITGTYHRSTVRADVQDIPLQDGALDGVVILHVLEHVQSHQVAAAELGRVIRPGGHLLVETPCDSSTERHLACSNDKARAWGGTEDKATNSSLCLQVDHRWALSCKMLASELAAAGFTCTREAELLSKELVERFGLAMGGGWFNSCVKN